MLMLNDFLDDGDKWHLSWKESHCIDGSYCQVHNSVLYFIAYSVFKDIFILFCIIGGVRGHRIQTLYCDCVSLYVMDQLKLPDYVSSYSALVER